MKFERAMPKGLILGVLSLVLGAALPARAQSVTVTVLEPREFGYVVFEPIAPKQAGGPKQGRISMSMRVTNNGLTPVRITEVRILGSKVSDFDAPVEVAPGASFSFQNCNCDGSVPLIINPFFPQTATVAVYLEGSVVPVTTNVSLLPHTNDGGPLSYPGKANDLRPNETWGASSAHGGGHQVFALDTGVLGWNSTGFSERFPGTDGSQKEHWRAYGMPVYAVADGTVCWALNDHQEPAATYSGEATISPSMGAFVGGGNQLFVKTGDEIFVIAHMQPGSIPPELLTPGAPVKKGQYLGKVGHSGASSHPHTHIHVKKERAAGAPDTTRFMNGCDEGWFRPMTFNNLQSLTLTEANTLANAGTLDASDWAQLTDHSAPNPYGLLYPSADPVPFNKTLTDSRQYLGVWRASSEIDLTVKSAGWTDFTAKWQELSADRFRLVEVNTFVENGERQYLAHYRRGTGGHYLWSLAGWDAFKAKWTEMDSAGYRLVDFDTYLEGTTRYYVGVWRSGSDAQKLELITGWDAFSTRVNTLESEGLRLVDVETYLLGGVRVYVGAFRAGTGSSEVVSINGWANFTTVWGTLSQQGLRLMDIETYASGGTRQFIGVFRQGTGGYAFESHTGYSNFVQANERYRGDGLRLVDIHVEQ